MNRRELLGVSLAAAGSLAHPASGRAMSSPNGPTMRPTSGIDLPVLGTLKPRSAKEIAASSWSIGGETLDRDYAVYDHYKRYLGPLGAKAIRLQAGWAKCEKKRGVYSWEWLDAIIDDARAQGVQPWLEASYGNKLYPGGGDTGLGGGFPTSAEGLAGWDRWVRALVERYRDRVHAWEIWNEPDINKAGTAPVTGYVDLYLRTAAIVRELQPKGRLYALALAHDLSYAGKFLAAMKERGRLDLIDAITVHTYPRNPDTTGNIDRLRALIAKCGRAIEVRQGETGAPSSFQTSYALSGISWTETMQAKWDLRRMLAHHAKGVPFNLFTLCDLHYRGTGGRVQMNYKGLLATNSDQTVARVKPSYRAAQCVFTVFDDTLKPVSDYSFTTTALRTLTVDGYARQDGTQVTAYWFNDAPPDDGCGGTAINLTLAAARFTDPVLIDLRTGLVHAIAKDRWSRGAGGVTFRAMPAYDSPILLAERANSGIDAIAAPSDRG